MLVVSFYIYRIKKMETTSKAIKELIGTYPFFSALLLFQKLSTVFRSLKEYN